MPRSSDFWTSCIRRGSLHWARRLGAYSLVLRALVLLLWARLLVAIVPMRYWRASLGTIRDEQGAGTPGPATWTEVPAELRRIVKAVERASLRLPITLRCLPRAMVVQWMGRRRNMDCTLRIGIEKGAEEELHAWVDCGQVILIGNLPHRSFVQIMAIRTGTSAQRAPRGSEGRI